MRVRTIRYRIEPPARERRPPGHGGTSKRLVTRGPRPRSAARRPRRRPSSWTSTHADGLVITTPLCTSRDYGVSTRTGLASAYPEPRWHITRDILKTLHTSSSPCSRAVGRGRARQPQFTFDIHDDARRRS
ncbi:hypothetical protein EVAR_77395_1 [Eumeta japonica]|uniref:Uncharacterized protein n=1 Tax=Eumeta variegata TaxID=151549 RepID=A0A4C1UXU4_EUMVA|nr:hypothetical protein EVAR_77395_1 [Eumeta japonica]